MAARRCSAARRAAAACAARPWASRSSVTGRGSDRKAPGSAGLHLAGGAVLRRRLGCCPAPPGCQRDEQSDSAAARARHPPRPDGTADRAGQETGTPRTSPVDLFERDGRYWLVATHDANASWVHNVRAAGEGALATGRRRYAFSAAQLSQAEAAIVFTEVLAPRIAKPLAGLVLRRTLGVGPGAPPDAFAAAAALHPVFELTLSPASSPRPVPSGARRPA